jgi:multidrug efflux pump subunit AcrA (membrane-fusion protein)
MTNITSQPKLTIDPARVLKKRRQRRRRKVVTTVAVVAALGGGLAGIQSARADQSPYRLAEVTLGDATQTINLTGTITTGDRHDAAFSVGGIIETINVELGQVVEPGQLLATLDPQSLENAVTAAQDSLASAQQRLQDNLDAQGRAAELAELEAEEATRPEKPPTTELPPTVTQAQKAVANAQTDLLQGYVRAQEALQSAGSVLIIAQDSHATATQIYDDATQICAQLAQPEAPEPRSADLEIEPAPEETPDQIPESPDSTQACLAALGAVLASSAELNGSQLEVQVAQAMFDTAQRDLQNLSQALDQAVANLMVAVQQYLSEVNDSNADANRPGGAGVNGLTGTGTAATITAEQILSDRSAVTAAEAALAIAKDNASHTELTSRIGGVVASIDATPGEQLPVSQTAITVLGSNSFIVEATASLTSRQLLEIGQNAEITLAGSNNSYEGIVSSIGISNVSSSSTPAYVVALTVATDDANINFGGSAWAQIEVVNAQQVLVVPTSAVSVNGTITTVKVLRDGTAVSQPVTTGASGSIFTEIIAGLELGEQVVLADLTKELTPAGADSSLTSLGGSTMIPGSSTMPAMPDGAMQIRVSQMEQMMRSGG